MVKIVKIDYYGEKIQCILYSNGFLSWREFDENNRVVHIKNSDDFEAWYEYSDNGTHITSIDGYETWLNENNNIIRRKYPDGHEEWYDDKGNLTAYRYSVDSKIYHAI